jgi:hypothetical protein
MSNVRRIVLVFASLLFAAVAGAELPPYVYAGWQAAAGEALRVRVVDVRVTDRGEGDPDRGRPVAVVATLEVIEVARSATGLKPGDRIAVRYDTRVGSRIPGPSPIPVLTRGAESAAWLTRQGETYAPAAGGWSFREGDRPTTTTAPTR